MLELKDIELNFAYKSVLRGINLTFEQGQIYSLLGENGAGKSTLAKIICGELQPSIGKIFLDEKELRFTSPKQAISKGICLVHQRPLLAPNISIKENCKIGNKHFDNKKMQSLLLQFISNISEKTLVKTLTPSQKFYTALICALLKEPKILLIDEPSDSIKKILRTLASQGLIIIMITHNLTEALENADEVILLKKGKIIQKTKVNETSVDEIKSKLYENTTVTVPPKNIIHAVMDEENFYQQYQKQKITTSTTSSNTTGVKISTTSSNTTGVKISTTSSTTTGVQISPTTKKISYIPSDKTFRASNPHLTVLQMLTANHTNENETESIKRAVLLLEKANVNIKLNELCSNLSGGMLQRLILEREISEKPKTIILFNPTQGLDILSTQKLYAKLEKLAANDTTVILANESDIIRGEI